VSIESSDPKEVGTRHLLPVRFEVAYYGVRQTIPLWATFETPADPSASAIHEIVRRKRTYVSSIPVPRLFIVDDEHVIASTLAAILKPHGYCATFFTSPLGASVAARSRAPDLLISEVAMLGISGIDLAIQMKAQYPACKVLLFSG
jgi:PleD family two-component response regulator